jgi:hypothetical protein
MTPDTFPTLQANQRSYGLPDRASSAVVQTAGVSVRFLHSMASANGQVEITLLDLTRAQAQQISSHYRGRKQHGPFYLPASVWQTHASLDDLAPRANRAYRYLAAPAWEPTGSGLYNVTIQIESFM